jgi:glc operon protein GlcG
MVELIDLVGPLLYGGEHLAAHRVVRCARSARAAFKEEEPMKTAKLSALILAVSVIVAAAAAHAQAPQPYGPPISLDQAKKAMVAAEAEARKNNWPVAIVIVDSGGNLVMMQRLDNTQFGSNEVARQKAHTAVAFKRPSKVFQDLIAQGGGNLRLLKVDGVAPLEGAVPIIVNGQVVGAIGVSGVQSQQDAQVAQAGADSLK